MFIRDPRLGPPIFHTVATRSPSSRQLPSAWAIRPLDRDAGTFAQCFFQDWLSASVGADTLPLWNS